MQLLVLLLLVASSALYAQPKFPIQPSAAPSIPYSEPFSALANSATLRVAHNQNTTDNEVTCRTTAGAEIVVSIPDANRNVNYTDVVFPGSGGPFTGKCRSVASGAGKKGDPGTAGSAANVTIGTVTTVAADQPAAVTNSGDAQNVVLNVAIPRGPAGTNGTNGTGGASTAAEVALAPVTGVTGSTVQAAIASLATTRATLNGQGVVPLSQLPFAAFSVAFTGQSTQTVSAATTKVSDRAYIRACYDTSVTPAALTMPFGTTLNQSTYALTVDMGSAFTGYCVGGESSTGGTRVNFSAQSSLTVAASTHGLADKATVRGCTDASGDFVMPYSVTLNQSTFALVIDMGSSFTGYCLLQ